MTAISNKDRQKRYHDNMKDKGYVRLEAWVKKENKEYLKKIINNAIESFPKREDEIQNFSDTAPQSPSSE
jgi:hydroxylamine reductase (hybrid-cluster protein)